MDRSSALEGAGVQHWRCSRCKRRFVVAQVGDGPGLEEAVWPVFLDGVPSTGETQQEGATTKGDSAPPPDHLKFTCRCGCRLIARGKTYTSLVTCLRCGSRLKLKVAYRTSDQNPIALVEYPGDGAVPT